MYGRGGRPCGKDEDGGISWLVAGTKTAFALTTTIRFLDAMYGDVRPLLDKPELVADTRMNTASAVFWPGIITRSRRSRLCYM